MELSRRMKALMEERGLDQKAFAKALGISQPAVSHYLNGERTPGALVVAKLDNVFHMEIKGLLDEGTSIPVDISKGSISVPIWGDISAGHPLWPMIEVAGDERRVEVPRSWIKRDRDDYFALVVAGESMSGANIHNGDLVILEKLNGGNPTGRICAVRITGEGMALRRVYLLNQGIRLLAANPAVAEIKFGPEDQAEVEVLGVVKFLIRGFGEEAVLVR